MVPAVVAAVAATRLLGRRTGRRSAAAPGPARCGAPVVERLASPGLTCEPVMGLTPPALDPTSLVDIQRRLRPVPVPLT